jgi:hypothetical protein
MVFDGAQIGSYADLGDVWFRDQTMRILHRHMVFGRHCRLDLDELLTRLARMRTSSAADFEGAVGSLRAQR